jgi:hypothetical protein
MEITGTATHSATLTAPVRVERIEGDTLYVVTLPGGKGGWATPGKRLTVNRRIFTQD